jgi:hypothetical protein
VWPKEPEKRLATQLLLFRSAAEGGKGDVIAGYGRRFTPSQEPSINNSAHRFIDQVFRPMAAELRRHLERELAAVPAADRVVSLNHNSPKYKAAADALEALEDTLTGTNGYPDAEDKEQKIPEVSAARRLLRLCGSSPCK